MEPILKIETNEEYNTAYSQKKLFPADDIKDISDGADNEPPIIVQEEIDANMKTEEKSTCKCSTYSYQRAQKNRLKQHMHPHTGEKPFQCNICSYKFAQKGHLKTHMSVHSGEKPLQCNICDYRCARKNVLKGHMSVHSGEKPQFKA